MNFVYNITATKVYDVKSVDFVFQKNQFLIFNKSHIYFSICFISLTKNMLSVASTVKLTLSPFPSPSNNVLSTTEKGIIIADMNPGISPWSMVT